MNLHNVVVEEEYMDVLMNIETIIVGCFKRNNLLHDHNVLRAIEALITRFRKQLPKTSLPNLPEKNDTFLYEPLLSICCLHVNDFEENESDSKKMRIITIDELILCLKRLEKSVKMWNRNGGSQGYLKFVTQYLP